MSHWEEQYEKAEIELEDVKADRDRLAAERDQWKARAEAEWLAHDERAATRISAHVRAERAEARLAEAEKLIRALAEPKSFAEYQALERRLRAFLGENTE